MFSSSSSKKLTKTQIKTDQGNLSSNPSVKSLPYPLIAITKLLNQMKLPSAAFWSTWNRFSHYLACKVRADWIRPWSLRGETRWEPWAITTIEPVTWGLEVTGILAKGPLRDQHYPPFSCGPFIYFWCFLPVWMPWIFHFKETDFLAVIFPFSLDEWV